MIVEQWKLNASRYKGQIFCCKEHWNEYHSTKMGGENSPAWRGGTPRITYIGGWKVARKRATLRDNHSCRCCGEKQKVGEFFDVHHITPYESFENKWEANSLENLITVCRKCHSKFHPNYKGVRPTWQEA